MPLSGDSDDEGFMSSMEKLFGMDESAVSDLLSKLTLEQMIDLANFVNNKDIDAAQAIVQSVPPSEDETPENDVEPPTEALPSESDAAPPSTEEDEADAVSEAALPRKRRTTFSSLQKATSYNVGDAVKIGKDEATVKIVNGPGDTMGVMVGGKMKMVDKKNVKHLDEMVLGITNLPDITRMRELAGLASGPEATQTTASTPMGPRVSFSSQTEKPFDTRENECGNESDPAQSCMDAIGQLERALPNVKLSDLKAIRQKISELTTKMNESLDLAGKKIVSEAFKGPKSK